MSELRAERPGYYGKLPSHGDFLQRRLRSEFVQPWDAWLQNGIATSRAQLGDAWRERYLSAPIWRFALQPGVCGASGWVGVLMPSVDRVGRCFPFTVAAACAPNVVLFAAAAKLQDWYIQTEHMALAALEDNFDLEQWESLPAPEMSLQWEDALTETHAQLALRLQAFGELPYALLALLEAAYSPGRACLWWHPQSKNLPARVELSDGLIAAETFARLL